MCCLRSGGRPADSLKNEEKRLPFLSGQTFYGLIICHFAYLNPAQFFSILSCLPIWLKGLLLEKYIILQAAATSPTQKLGSGAKASTGVAFWVVAPSGKLTSQLLGCQGDGRHPGDLGSAGVESLHQFFKEDTQRSQNPVSEGVGQKSREDDQPTPAPIRRVFQRQRHLSGLDS